MALFPICLLNLSSLVNIASHANNLLSCLSRSRTMAAMVREEKEVKIADESLKKEETTMTEATSGEEVVEEVRAKLEETKVGLEEVVAKDGKQDSKLVEQKVEPKTGVSFLVELDDGKQLAAMGLRKKKILALGINIYAFGMYADNVKLKELLKSKFSKAPEKPTKELYEAVINSDVGMQVRLVIVFRGLSMSLVRKNFDEGLGGSLKKLTGGQKNEELINKVMGAEYDSIKLPSGSIIDITRLPGYVLQTKVKGEQISKVNSELLCRAYFHMYLGDDAFDKDAKERFGGYLLSLF